MSGWSRKKEFTPRREEDYTPDQWCIIKSPDLPDENWKLEWSNIGLNWIDTSERASRIYDIYLTTLNRYKEIFLNDLTNDKSFFSYLFDKSAVEIAYRLLIKHPKKKNVEFRIAESCNPHCYDLSSTFFELLISYLISCLGCKNELQSTHRSAVDLECKCGIPHEVKSIYQKKEVNEINTGAVRGINNLIENGFLIIIFQDKKDIYKIKKTSLTAQRIRVLLDDKLVSTLEDFRSRLDENPNFSFRNYKTKFRFKDEDLQILPLEPCERKKIILLKENLNGDIERSFTDNLFRFEEDLITTLNHQFGLNIHMTDDKSFLQPRVKLINDRNFINSEQIARTVENLFIKMNEQIDMRLSSEQGDVAQHRDGAAAVALGSRPAQEHRDGAAAVALGSRPAQEHGHASQHREGAAAVASNPRQAREHVSQHRDGASASSIGSQIVRGTLVWYDPDKKLGNYYFNSKEQKIYFDLKKNQRFKDQSVSMTFKDGNLASVFLLGGGNINNIYLKMNEKNEEMYKEKYLKYKNKYIQLKSLLNTN